MQSAKALQLSEYSDAELVQEWETATKLNTAGKNRSYVQDYFTASAWLEVRDEIERRGLGTLQEVKELDERLLKAVLIYGAEGNDEPHPPNKWWWHLDKIAKRIYPPQELPEHLRALYLSHQS